LTAVVSSIERIDKITDCHELLAPVVCSVAAA
jgi:hypothetical protein